MCTAWIRGWERRMRPSQAWSLGHCPAPEITPSGSVSRQTWSPASQRNTCTFPCLGSHGLWQSNKSSHIVCDHLNQAESFAVAQQWKYSCKFKQAQVWFVISYQCPSMSTWLIQLLCSVIVYFLPSFCTFLKSLIRVCCYWSLAVCAPPSPPVWFLTGDPELWQAVQESMNLLSTLQRISER